MRRFVVVEGLIGVGKTTLCRRLAQARSAELVLEPHEDNPFLEAFYRDPVRYALPVQMYFLLTRFRQQDTVRQHSLFAEWVVSDYLFEKDRLFAEKTLAPAELELYDRLAASLGALVPTPDLVVALDAPVSLLLARVKERGIAGEEHIDRRYLDDLARRYDRLWSGWNRCPVVRIDSAAIDTRTPEGLQHILDRIDGALAGPTSSERGSALQPDLFTGR